ncbi:2-dehydro-3-deoxyphosphooctonate aldolase [Flavobacterium sp. SUN052]|uniref:2-dehydro-3-deoxyphosphooctonate aldolase n=1 Tax=Flavobacterium sp. SUN052 TaxID=3002441 RepID=UPI00237EBD6A|nr:2-dehydro-3-deoxyphosphooctonate aldolase [Flavobacterium sp. SUN052]MEC4005239.1 2-dehydro-3-deoxyphosphooctonate aldolase [Flavobacterium sp. SUN052]
MKKYNLLFLLAILCVLVSCGGIKSTLKNVDDSATKPVVISRQFVLTEYALDNKYAYDKDYPVNLGFENEKYSPKNITYFFNALTGPNGEKISYEKIDTCCPFPTKKSVMGAGTLEIYQVTIEGSDKKLILYINIYEKGKVLCPKGFLIKKPSTSNN